MLRSFLDWWDKTERRMRYAFGDDITDPVQRRLSYVHFYLLDHAILRTFWHNHAEIAPGVFRSNQPTHRRFARYARDGLRTVINLRGEDRRAHYLFEEESCRRLGLTLVNAKLWARNAPPAENLLAAIEALRTARKPVLFHCKSGADRTGIIGAFYMIVFEGKTVAEARPQLGLRYLHLKSTKTGVQDYILDVYEARQAHGAIGVEDWLRREYDPQAVQHGFDTRRPAADLALPK